MRHSTVHHKSFISIVTVVVAAVAGLCVFPTGQPASGEQQVTSDTNPRSADAAKDARRRSRPARPRIEPVEKENWSPEQQELLAPFERTGRLFNVFTTMANHPDLANDWMTFATYILPRTLCRRAIVRFSFCESAGCARPNTNGASTW